MDMTGTFAGAAVGMTFPCASTWASGPVAGSLHAGRRRIIS